MAEPPDERRRHRGVTRRDFLRGAASGVLAGGLVPAALLEGKDPKAAATEVRGPGEVPVVLQVNGRTRRLQIEPRVTLLDALRNRLDLTGAKRVCDRGICGACTVLLGGRPVYACSVLAIEAEGRGVETVESLRGAGGGLHPVQAAFVEHDAQQCGFCTPGFVMAAKALLDRHPNPRPEHVARGLGGNLCRCGTYAGMRRAVQDAAQALRPAGKKGG